MKKAKLLLSAVALFAVLSTAFAFKVELSKIYVDTTGDKISDTYETGLALSSSGTATVATTTIGVTVFDTFKVAAAE